MATATQSIDRATSDYASCVLEVIPEQGHWHEPHYLNLINNRRVELVDGQLEFLEMPTDSHQELILFICDFLRRVAKGADVKPAGVKIRIAPRRFREPDVLMLINRADPRRANKYWSGADVVVEIVSPNQSARDYIDKRADYAQAGIAEYWIVDPASKSVLQLLLEGNTYREAGTFTPGTNMPCGFDDTASLDIGELFDQIDKNIPEEPRG